MGATRLQDMILILPAISFLYFFFPKNMKKNKMQSFLLFAFIIFITTLIFHLPFLLGKDTAIFNSQLHQFWKSGLTHNFRGFFSPSLILTFQFLNLNFSLFGFIFITIGSFFLYQKNLKIFSFLFLWTSIPLLFYGNLLTTAPRFFTILLPPLYIIQGALFNRLFNINLKFKIITLMAYTTLIVITFIPIYPILSYRHKKALLPDYARWISQKTEPNAYIIIGDDRLFMQYYGHRKILGRPLKIHNLSDNELQKFQIKLDNLLNKDIPVYATYIGLYDYDPHKKFSTFIIKNYTLTMIGKHLYEDWHKGELTQRVIYNPLVKINKKSNKPSH